MVEVRDVLPTETLLDYLRERERSTGTKEACREGDCGACSVVLGRVRNGKLTYRAVNSCILLLGQIEGAEVLTVEDLATRRPDAGPSDPGELHPVQQALVDKHASQCGYCTPGFVMSLFALYQSSDEPVDRDTVNDWIAGNLCRCTGYRPIVDAALEACTGRRNDRFVEREEETASALTYMIDGNDVFIGDDKRFFAAPASLDSLAALYDQNPDATIVAGATDVGLWVTKQMRDLPKIISLGRVEGLDLIDDVGDGYTLYAGVTLERAIPVLNSIDPDIGELLRRFASRQIRASGTVCGNIANGSPIGDLPPVLIALGADLTLRRGPDLRTMPLESFYIDYGVQQREPGELVLSVTVPRLAANESFRCYKVSKRFDQDISAVMGAFYFRFDEEHDIVDARLAYGGMAGIPKRAEAAEQALVGANIRDSRRWSQAFAALRHDFSPLDDHRASARYRIETAHALLGKALIELAGTSSSRTRVVGHREDVHVGG